MTRTHLSCVVASAMATIGVQTGVPSNLPDALQEAIDDASANFLVVPLVHPRYERSPHVPRAEPVTRSDTLLNSGEWTTQIVGEVSPWLQLDSADVGARRRSEVAFKQELAWASHLSLPALLLPPPGSGCVNYAHCVNQTTLANPAMQMWVRVPLHAPAAPEPPPSAAEPPAAAAPAPTAWSCWNQLRRLCEQSVVIGVALELGLELPEDANELRRWCGEPLRAVIIPTSAFMTNKKGYPALSRKHQAALALLMRHHPRIIVRGRPDASAEGLAAHLLYLRHVLGKLPPMSQTERFESPYYDYLQAPLQPLQDDLESQTYETFEKDPVKYKQYQLAVRRALEDKHKATATDASPVMVMVVGAGRGPLVAASLAASVEAGVPIRVYAVEKNANAVICLQNRVLSEPDWAERVTVVNSDMREWVAPAPADILVSELLGSWGDNELSPECLDGAQRFLRPGGISIPCDYTSFVAPLSSHKLWNEVKTFKDLAHFETAYVVKVHNAFQLADAQPLFRFVHPNAEAPPDNGRYGSLTFTAKLGGECHGFVGYFHSTLYEEVCISTEPSTVSEGMFSWFPLYVPLRHPIPVADGATIEAHFWRHASHHKVWYEWALTQPTPSPIHNPNGRSYFIGL